MGFCISDSRLNKAHPGSECFGLSPTASRPVSPEDSFSFAAPEENRWRKVSFVKTEQRVVAASFAAAVPVLSEEKPFENLVAYSVDATQNAQVRSEAIDMLEEASPQFPRLIASLVADSEPLVRVRVARHLSRVEREKQEAVAEELKKDSSPAVRAQLARSLRRINAPWALSVLMTLAEDSNKKVSAAANRTLLKTKIKALASLPASLRTREMQLGMMDRYLSGDARWKAKAHDILIRWGLMDEAVPKQMIVKYGNATNDAGLTVNTVRQKVESQLQGQDLLGLSAEQFFVLYKILEEVHVGPLPDIIKRNLRKTAAPYADLKPMVAFSPYLTSLLKGLEAKSSGTFMVSRSSPGEFQITFQIGSLAFLDLGRYRSSPGERSPQLIASQNNQVAL